MGPSQGMAFGHALRGRRTQDRDTPAAAPAAVDALPEPTGLLALQRSAGNAAVGAWLRRGGAGAGGGPAAGVLARDRGLPAEPQTLSDVAPVAKDVTVDTDVFQPGRLGGWFDGGRPSDREGLSVGVRFGGDMAAKAGDAKVEAKLEHGLAGMAMSAFQLRVGDDAAPVVDVTRFVDLDLTPFGGKDGHYRFTSVASKYATRAGKRALTEVDVIVELVRPARVGFKPWKSLDGPRRHELENRFSGAGFTRAQATLTKVVDEWTEDQLGFVYQALEAIPESMLRSVPDIVWERGHGKHGPTGEGGYFEYSPNPVTRHLTLYDGAFESDEILIELIAHEFGHAVSYKPPSAGAGGALATSAEFQEALRLDGGKAITDYAKKSVHEHYAEAYSLFIAEPDTLKLLRPKVYAYFAKQQTAAASPGP